MSEQMAFDELQDDLFKLFILHFWMPRFAPYIDSKDLYNQTLREYWFDKLLDLFPREIHQERKEYDGYISDYGKVVIKTSGCGFEIQQRDDHYHFKHKIRFYFTDDNKQD